EGTVTLSGPVPAVAQTRTLDLPQSSYPTTLEKASTELAAAQSAAPPAVTPEALPIPVSPLRGYAPYRGVVPRVVRAQATEQQLRESLSGFMAAGGDPVLIERARRVLGFGSPRVPPPVRLLNAINDIAVNILDYQAVRSRVDEALKYLSSDLRARRAISNNITYMAQSLGVSRQQAIEEIGDVLGQYANLYRSVRPVNEVQRLVQEAAVAVSEQRWRDARRA